MKKRNLPLSLLLIFIVLGGLSLSFYLSNNDMEYTPRNPHKQLKNRLGKPATQFLAQIRNNQNSGVINPADIKLRNEELEKISSSRSAELSWIQMGPDNFGGRTRAILCQQLGDNSIVTYAAGVSGGIWKSENLGTTWHKINTNNDNLNVTCMVESSKGDIYVGTGETFDTQDYSGLSEMGYTSGFMGQGIFKSTDGENFSLLSATKPTFNNVDSDWAFINELAINTNNDKIWAATNTGLKYSSDGGETWATATDVENTPLDKFSWDVQVGSDGGVVACVDNLCYVSLNGTDKFVLRSTGDSVGLPNTDVERIKFAIAPSDPKVVYASVVNSSYSIYNIYKSNDGGINWYIVMPGTNSINVFNNQGVYNNALAVFPDDPGKVLLGGIDLWLGTMYQEDGFYDWKSISQNLTGPQFPTYLHEDQHVYEFVPGVSNQFFVGTDGGVFIGKIQSGLLDVTYQTGNRNYFTTQFYAVGTSGMKHVLLGGSQDVGTIQLTGEGNTSEYGEEIFTGEGGPCAISLIDDNVLVVSTTDGIIRRSDDGGINYSSFEQFPTDEISNSAFRTALTLYENFDNQYSSDTTWFFAKDTIPGGTKVQVQSHNAGQPFNYTTPDALTLYPGDSIPVKDVVTSYLFVGVRHNIWLTTNFMQFDEVAEWYELSNPDFGFVGLPYSVALSADGNHLFVGTIDGKLYRISNLASANTYERADVNSPGCIVSTTPIELLVPGTEDNVSQVVTSIAIDGQNPNNVLVTLGNYGNENYVLFSDNALAQKPDFKSAQGNLPHMPVYSSILEMTDPNMAIVGTEMGIYTTDNIHASSPQWTESTTEMGRVPVFDLKQQIVDQPKKTVALDNGVEITYEVFPGTDNFGSIYAASYGRGLFRSDDFYLVGLEEFAEESPNKSMLKLYPNPVKTHTTIELKANTNQDVVFYVYDLRGRMVHSKATTITKGLNKVDLKINNLERGSYVVKALIDGQSETQKFIVN